MGYALIARAQETNQSATPTKQDILGQQYVEYVPVYKNPQPTFSSREERRIVWEPIIREAAEEKGLSYQEASLLVKIAECESGFQMKWNYLHDTNPEYYTAYGLFQVVRGHEATYGVSRMTPEGNIQIAIQLYLKNGTGDWNLSKGCWSTTSI